MSRRFLEARQRTWNVVQAHLRQAARIRKRRIVGRLLRSVVDDGLGLAEVAGTHVELGQCHLRLDRVWVVGAGLAVPLLGSLVVAGRAGGGGEADSGEHVLRVCVEHPLEALRGIGRLAIAQVEPRQVDQGGRIVGLELQCLVELAAGLVLLSRRGVHGRREVAGLRVRALALHQRLRLGDRLVVVALAQQCGEQQVVALQARRAALGHLLEQLDRLVEVARHQVAARDLELYVGRLLGLRTGRRLREIRQRLLAVTARQAHAARHRQHRRIGVVTGQCRFERGERLLGGLLLRTRFGQQPLHPHVVRLVGEHVLEMHLGLAEVALLRVDDAEQRARLVVLGHRCHGFFEQRARFVEVAAGRGNLSAQLLHHRVVRRGLRELLRGRRGVVDLALAHLRFGQRAQRHQAFTAARTLVNARKRLLVSLLGGGQVAAFGIDAAHGHPVGRLLLDGGRGLVHDNLGRRQALGRVGGAGETQQRLEIAGLSREHGLELRPCFTRALETQQRPALGELHLGRHVGGSAVGLALLERRFEFAARHHHATLRHEQCLCRDAEILGLLHLDRSGTNLTVLNQRRCQQRTRVAVVRLVLEEILQVDDRRACLALVQRLLGTRVQGLAFRRTGGQRDGEHDQRAATESHTLVDLCHAFIPQRPSQAPQCRSFPSGRTTSAG